MSDRREQRTHGAFNVDFLEKVCTCIYFTSKGHALQVTGLEKKTQDIGRFILYIGRKSRQTCIIFFCIWIQAFAEFTNQRTFEQI